MPSTTWHNLSDEKRDRIVLAAAAEFGSRGFTAGSLNVVAREADVAKGSLFQYFEDKLDLFRHVADEMARRTRAHMLTRLDEHMARQPQLFHVLREMLLEWIVFHRGNELERRMLLAVTYEPDAQVRQTLHATFDQHFVEVIGDVVAVACKDGALRDGVSIDHLSAWMHTLFTHTGIAAISPELNRFVALHAMDGDELRQAVDHFVQPLEAFYSAQPSDSVIDLRPADAPMQDAPSWVSPAQRDRS